MPCCSSRGRGSGWGWERWRCCAGRRSSTAGRRRWRRGRSLGRHHACRGHCGEGGGQGVRQSASLGRRCVSQSTGQREVRGVSQLRKWGGNYEGGRKGKTLSSGRARDPVTQDNALNLGLRCQRKVPPLTSIPASQEGCNLQLRAGRQGGPLPTRPLPGRGKGLLLPGRGIGPLLPGLEGGVAAGCQLQQQVGGPARLPQGEAPQQALPGWRRGRAAALLRMSAPEPPPPPQGPPVPPPSPPWDPPDGCSAGPHAAPLPRQ